MITPLELSIASILAEADTLTENEIQQLAPNFVLAPGAVMLMDLGPIIDPHCRKLVALFKRVAQKIDGCRFTDISSPKESATYLGLNQTIQTLRFLCVQRIDYLVHRSIPGPMRLGQNVQKHILSGWKLVVLGPGPGIIPGPGQKVAVAPTEISPSGLRH